MKIIIVGGGIVGSSLAEHLEKGHHDISLIEIDSRTCQNIGERLDILIICGSGSSPRLLEQAGIKSADMVIAVSPNDELNILVCAIARQYGVATRIARIRSNEFRSEDASIDIVIAADFNRTTSSYGKRGENYVYIEVGHAAENLHLQAVSEGLGSVPVGAFSEDAVKKLLNLPEGFVPIYIIPIGYVK